MNCQLCDTPIDEKNPRSEWAQAMVAHRECMLRSVMGGIGHLLDHDFWCLHKHDPDAGLTYRESAILVDFYMWCQNHDLAWEP